MIGIKLKFISITLAGLLVGLVSNTSIAGQTALGACKAIAGSAQTGGSVGVVNGSGSILATAQQPTIIICDIDGLLTGSTIQNISISGFGEDVAPTGDFVCSLTRYVALFAVQTTTTSMGPNGGAFGVGAFNINLTNSFAQPGLPSSYGLACRMGQGDRLDSFSTTIN